jgi:hypothetical protein
MSPRAPFLWAYAPEEILLSRLQIFAVNRAGGLSCLSGPACGLEQCGMERAPTILPAVAGKHVEPFRCQTLAQEGQGGNAASIV